MTGEERVDGPVDVIGDIHGCLEELEDLLERLGYERDRDYRHPRGRTPVLVGDPINRGPFNVATLRLVLHLWEQGAIRMVQSNHMERVERWLRGEPVPLERGLEATADEWEQVPLGELEHLRKRTLAMAKALPLYLLAEEGHTVIAHGGFPSDPDALRGSGQLRDFCLYGAARVELPDGRKVRPDWAASYQGTRFVVYGHTPCESAIIRHHTICVDTGCVYGNTLTAIQLPERTLVQVPARRTYASPTLVPEGKLRRFA